MDIKELISLMENSGLEIAKLDAGDLNHCIDMLEKLEQIAIQEDDMENAQTLKNARIYAEDIRVEKIKGM